MTGPVAGCILAGGLSRRMGGGDKGEVRFGGETLLTRIIGRFRPQVTSLMLNANGEAARFFGYGLPVLPDSFPGHAGPLAGLLTAVSWAEAQGLEQVVTVTCDVPFMPRDLVARLVAAKAPALAASDGQIHHAVGVWPVFIKAALEQALHSGVRKMSSFADQLSPQLVEWPAEPYDPFFNVNRPEDIAEAERMLREFNL